MLLRMYFCILLINTSMQLNATMFVPIKKEKEMSYSKYKKEANMTVLILRLLNS